MTRRYLARSKKKNKAWNQPAGKEKTKERKKKAFGWRPHALSSSSPCDIKAKKKHTKKGCNATLRTSALKRPRTTAAPSTTARCAWTKLPCTGCRAGIRFAVGASYGLRPGGVPCAGPSSGYRPLTRPPVPSLMRPAAVGPLCDRADAYGGTVST